jgi:ribosomal protein S18
MPSDQSSHGFERNGTAVICRDCPYQDVWYPVRTEREKCKHDLVHADHTVEYTDPDELSKVVTMDGRIVKRLDEQTEIGSDSESNDETLVTNPDHKPAERVEPEDIGLGEDLEI